MEARGKEETEVKDGWRRIVEVEKKEEEAKRKKE